MISIERSEASDYPKELCVGSLTSPLMRLKGAPAPAAVTVKAPTGGIEETVTGR
jgi:hypothetical protein